MSGIFSPFEAACRDSRDQYSDRKQAPKKESSRERKGNLKPDRYAFFATRLIPGKKLEMPASKKPYRNLIKDILAEPLFATNDDYGIAASTRLEVQRDSRLAPSVKVLI